MMTAGRATCIVFSDDDLPPEGLDHVRPLYITVGCSGRRVSSVLLDNGSALNVRPLTLEIEDFHRDFVAMSFDQDSSTMVLDMMRGMTSLPGMGLGRRWDPTSL
ncbi:hypothetical protein AAG906_022167 [Vitis piasezkii]